MRTALPAPRMSSHRLARHWRAIAAGARVLCRWCARRRQRRALGHLDDRLLADIGLTRTQAEAERRKPFWR
ncbi:MAG: DUF1127 domain-containing protein [Aquamicrobium sp.]|uniref:DUF1127 domain-containing protein n=1 Tax=Aquamicrobium sp. TaxID=1872579 RepID=UPI00349EDCA5|nr:DUF1127 domain-containing protein [Aquamicrobium sp.]MCO5156055.1 DUF1127 domain-containing protein [Aquamicrobium sp.]